MQCAPSTLAGARPLCPVRQAQCTFTSLPSAVVRCRPSLDSSMLVTTPAVARVRTGAATRTSHTLQGMLRHFAEVCDCKQATASKPEGAVPIVSSMHSGLKRLATKGASD